MQPTCQRRRYLQRHQGVKSATGRGGHLHHRAAGLRGVDRLEHLVPHCQRGTRMGELLLLVAV